VACFLDFLGIIGLAVEFFLQHGFMEVLFVALILLSNDSLQILVPWEVLAVLAITVVAVFAFSKALAVHLQTF